MPEESANVRIEVALSSGSLYAALRSLAEALKTEGMSQSDMYELFDHYRAKHQDDIDETKYDAILDIMDCVVGWCGPSARLFDSYLKR